MRVEWVRMVAIIPASPMTSRVARPSQARTSIVVTEGSVVNVFEVGCLDNELPWTASLGEWRVEDGTEHGEARWG
jgi:hypothetical protein